MIILASTSDKLQLVTGSAGAIDVHASWLDNNAGAVAPGRTNSAITTAATTDVVAAPGASVFRSVNTLTARNKGSSNNDITVRHTDGSNIIELHKQTLNPGQLLQYVDQRGFSVLPDAATPYLPFVSKTAAYNVIAADYGTVFNVSNSSFTTPWTFGHTVTAAQAGAGFRYRIRNTGAVGQVTIDPAGSETIDGRATLSCLVGHNFEVVCDGANWFTIGRATDVLLQRQAPAGANGYTLPLPAGYSSFDIEAIAVAVSGAQPNYLVLFFANDGVPTWITAGVYYGQFNSGLAGTAAIGQQQAATNAIIGMSQLGGDPRELLTVKLRPGDASYGPMWNARHTVLFDSSANQYVGTTGGSANIAGPITHALLSNYGGYGMTGGFITLIGNARP